MKTHYDTLGVPFGADYETIRKAYRQALKVYHPDLHEGDASAELHSKRIIDAHAVLKDREQRALYDEYVLHHRTQQRRKFFITLLLSAGLVCAGSLVLLQRSLSTETTAAAPSDRWAPAGGSTPAQASETVRVANLESSWVPVTPSPRERSDAPSYVAAAAEPPADIARPATAVVAEPPEAIAAPDDAVVAEPSEAIPAPDDAVAAEPSGAITEPAGAAQPPAAIAEPADAAAATPQRGTPEPADTVSATPSEAVARPADAAAAKPPEGVAEPADAVALTAPAEKPAPAAQQQTAWVDIDKRGNAEEIAAFIKEHPWAPEAALAERRLAELIETIGDVASLERLRAGASPPIALKLQARLGRLAPPITTGALDKERAEPAQPETLPTPALAQINDPGPQQEQATSPTAEMALREAKEHVRKGLASFKLGKHERAIASFDKAIELSPTNARYRLHRAAAWEGKGGLEQALADYDAAIDLDQTNIASFHARGLLLGRLKEYGRALHDLDRAIRFSFTDAKIYRDRGMIWYAMGHYNRAIADFSRAIALDPDFAAAYVSRGQAFQKKGDSVTAAVNFEKAANRDPSTAKARRELSQAQPENEEPVQKAPQASR